jgi:hypothetical protein
VVLSPAETDRLGVVLGPAGRTLAAADDRQWLCRRLEQAATDLTRRMVRAERASVRLDAPVGLDAGDCARVLRLLAQAAARLEQVAERRERQPYLVGPDYFRRQAHAARAWHADLGGLAARRADRGQPGRQAGGARTPGPGREAAGGR